MPYSVSPFQVRPPEGDGLAGAAFAVCACAPTAASENTVPSMQAARGAGTVRRGCRECDAGRDAIFRFPMFFERSRRRAEMTADQFGSGDEFPGYNSRD